MKFIFPKNYLFTPKLFGFIPYSSAIFVAILGILLICILNLFTSNLEIKISLFIFLFSPFILFSVIGFHDEDIVSVCQYIFLFFQRKQIYFYEKNNNP